MKNISLKGTILAEQHGGAKDVFKRALRVSCGVRCTRCVWIHSRYVHCEGSVRKQRLDRERFRKSQDHPWLTSVSKGTHKLLSNRCLLRIFFCSPRGRSLPGCYCQEDSGGIGDI